MIEKRIDELFQAITDSSIYRDYLTIGSVLEKDEEINQLIKEIKKLQQKSVQLEYHNDMHYKEIDKEIEKMVALLNSKPIYQEYLRRMNELNDVLAMSSSNIEQYVNSKI